MDITLMVAMQQDEGAGIISMLFGLLILILVIASWWKVFSKAGQPGWASIIPIYNAIVLLRIAGRPAWWLLLMLIPVVNLVIAIIVYMDFARSFGKGGGFAIGLLLLNPIFMAILAFGSATYQGPAAARPTPALA